jgi:L-ascorbate metabolism protein UlaG (beta-lactamase superfamily)
MKLFLTLILFLFFSNVALAQITFKWLGVSGFVLSDQVTTLVFDPAMTRVGLLDYLPFQTIKIDEFEVDYWMNKCQVKSVQGTFVNHAHTDHVIDAPYVVKKYGGHLYGSSSVINVGLGHDLPPQSLIKIEQGQEIKIGDFTIRPFRTPHPAHFLDILLMNGDILSPLRPNSSAWDYLVGETFSFLITHPKGNILFQAVSQLPDPNPLKDLKVDVLLLTIANRISTESLIQKSILPSKTKIVVPLHFDNFFYKMKREGEIDEFWGVKTSEFAEKVNQYSGIRNIWPKYCEEIQLLF